jgi:hypothetical protein
MHACIRACIGKAEKELLRDYEITQVQSGDHNTMILQVVYVDIFNLIFDPILTDESKQGFAACQQSKKTKDGVFLGKLQGRMTKDEGRRTKDEGRCLWALSALYARCLASIPNPQMLVRRYR